MSFPYDPTAYDPSSISTESAALSTYDMNLPNLSPSTLATPTKKFNTAFVDFSAANIVDGPTQLLFKDPGLNIVSFDTPSVIMILDRDSKITHQTNKFLLQTITKPQQEKFQVIETFGAPHLYFYGQRTPVYSIQGVLLDAFYDHPPGSTAEGPAFIAPPKFGTTPDPAWRNQWTLGFQNFYNTKLRGSRLKDTNSIAALYVNGWIIKGYPINLTVMKESNAMPDGVTFQMSWVIQSETLLNANQTDSYYLVAKNSDKLVKAMNEKSILLTQYQEALDMYMNDVTWWMTDQTIRRADKLKVDALAQQLTEKEKEIAGILANYGPRTRKILNID